MSQMSPPDPTLAVALARFAVISPLIHEHLSPPERQHRRQEILACCYEWPDGGQRRIPPRTLGRWLALYRQGGLDALKGRLRSDLGQSRRIDEAIIERAIELRRELPTRSTEHLIAMMGVKVNASTLRRILAKRGVSRRALAATGSGRAYPRYEQAVPNAVWQSDAMDGPWLPDPLHPGQRRKTHLIGLLDDYSRLVVHAQYYWTEGVMALQDATRQAILKYGLPEVLYTDNGPAYRSHQFAAMLARLGTRLIHATPYHPQGKGKCERFWLTVQTDCQIEMERADFSTLDELNTAFAAWLAIYQERVHTSTGEAPVVRWQRQNPPVRRLPLTSLPEVWLWETVRQVDKAGLVRLQGNTYQVVDSLVGSKVLLRYDPLDLSRIQVWHQGRRLQYAGLYHLQTQTVKGLLPSPEAARLLPLASARTFHEGQVRIHRQQIEQQVGELPPEAGPALSPTLHADRLITVCQDLLAPRLLAAGECEQIVQFVAQYGILDATLSHQILTRAIALKGIERPLTYYLRRLAQAMEEGPHAEL